MPVCFNFYVLAVLYFARVFYLKAQWGRIVADFIAGRYRRTVSDLLLQSMKI